MPEAKMPHGIFNPMREPFTITEIAEAIGTNWHTVRYAYNSLCKRESTRAIVCPADDLKPLMLNARAADLVVRHIFASEERKRERMAKQERTEAWRRKRRRKRAASTPAPGLVRLSCEDIQQEQPCPCTPSPQATIP